MVRLILALLACISTSVLGQRPHWISKPPSSSSDIYVVAIGDGANANDAQAEAKTRGWTELVEQVLGMEGVSVLRAESDLRKSDLQHRTELSTALVQFKTVITIAKHIEPLPGAGFRCYLLLKLPAREIVRIRASASVHGSGRHLSRLSIESDPPGGQVLIDGEVTGLTPIKLLLPPKSYRVEVKKDGFKTRERLIVLDPGSDFSVDLSLEKPSGFLNLATEPVGVEVILDGVSIGVSPIVNRDLPAGHHQVQFRANGYHVSEREFSVREGRITNLQVNLTPEASQLRLTRMAEIIQRQNWPELIAAGKQLLTANPQSSEAYMYVGFGLMRLQRTQAAIETFKLAHEHGESTVTNQLLCQAHNQAGSYDEAIRFCERAIELNLSNGNAYAHLAHAFRGKYKFQQAYDTMMVAIGLNKALQSELRSLCGALELRLHGRCAHENFPEIYK